MTQEQYHTLQNLIEAVWNGDRVAEYAAYDWLCECGYPSIARYHQSHLGTANNCDLTVICLGGFEPTPENKEKALTYQEALDWFDRWELYYHSNERNKSL